MTDTRTVAKEYRLAYWTQVIKDRINTGESIRTYCERSGIHENTYFYWQRKLRESTCVEWQADKPHEALPASTPNGWSMLCVGKDTAQPQGLTVEVGGCRITVNNSTDIVLLTKVCQALQTIC